MDRISPHSIDAEQGVLGCILLNPVECLAECVSRLKLGAETFYDLKHQVIYDALLKLSDARQSIDVITLCQKLKDLNQFEACGGYDYVAPLPDKVASSANLSFYLNIVLEKFLLRRVLSHCNQFTDTVYESSDEVAGIIESFEASAMGVAEVVMENRDTSIKDLVKTRLSFYEDCLARGGALLGMSSGFRDLDRMTDGLKGGDMIVLAARPSCGKTSLAMNIVENLAIAQGIPCGVFSLEMSREALVGRMVSSRARVNERTLTGGMAKEDELRRVFTASTQIANAPIHIDDSSGLTITQLRAKARRMVQRHKVKLIVIDYLQLLRTAKRRDNRREEIDEISNGVKAMAKELNIPVIAICQLNRELEKDKDRKPRVSDLRESGQIEQDADIIAMLYAADPAQAAQGALVLQVNALISKQRNGPTGDVPLTFFKEFTRFESISKIEQ